LFFYYRFPIAACSSRATAAAVLVRKLIRTPESETNDTQKDVVDLLTNVPWIILLSIGFLFMMFNGIKIGATAYYFKHYVGPVVSAADYFSWLPDWLTSGQEILVSATSRPCWHLDRRGTRTGFLARRVAQNLFVLSLAGRPDSLLHLLPRADAGPCPFILGIGSEFFAAIMPTLFFSMLGDCADYSEWKNRRRATGLVYSAGTFINKAGGGFAGALILMVLAAYGYDGMDETTIGGSIGGMKALMSWIPSAFAFLGAGIMLWYPLNDARMKQIESDLAARRQG
jgi:Na+/melibiose symporter-like transporter